MKHVSLAPQPWLKLFGASALVALSLLAVSLQPATHAEVQAQKESAQEQAGSLKSLPAKGKRYALIIGVDKYADTQIATLGGASNDARALADALVRYAGFPADQVILLATDQPAERQPTRGNILRRLSNLANDFPKDGLLLFSFAGHGMERGGQAFLLPSDAQVSDDVTLLEQTAVNVVNVRDWVKKSGAKQVLMLLDACRNDPGGRADAPNNLTETYMRGFNFNVRNREVEAFATLYATDIGHRAYEYKEKKQGYFTWALVEGLKGAAANERGEVTLDGLVKYLEERVPKQVRLDLGAGKVQRPHAVIEGYKADALVLSVGGERGLNIAQQADEEPESRPAAREEGEEKSRDAPAVKLEGTIWEGTKDAAPYTIEFLPNHKLRYTLVFTKGVAGGSWKQIGDHVQIDIANYSVLNGKIEGGIIKGTGENAEGTKWEFLLSPKEK
jgi:hypothetical protein